MAVISWCVNCGAVAFVSHGCNPWCVSHTIPRVAERRHFCIGRLTKRDRDWDGWDGIRWEVPLLWSSDAFGAGYLGFSPQAINWHRIRDSIAIQSYLGFNRVRDSIAGNRG